MDLNHEKMKPYLIRVNASLGSYTLIKHHPKDGDRDAYDETMGHFSGPLGAMRKLALLRAAGGDKDLELESYIQRMEDALEDIKVIVKDLKDGKI